MAKPETSLVDRAQRLLRARPSDYMLALSQASASLPVIGRHLEPLGGMTAMSVWGTRHLPDFLSTTARTWLAPGSGEVRRRERDQTRPAARDALRDLVPADLLAADWPEPDRTPPALRALQHRRYLHRAAVRYGSEPTQLLDVWRRRDLPAGKAPVLVFIPGGAWVHGSRTLQGYALMSHLAQQGWVCLSVEYRVAPHNPWPNHLIDVKTAIAWARANVDKFGGDRNFVAVAGCSAGGHLAALAGLTAGDPALAADLPEGADTSVDAVVPIYGRYDWQDRSTPEREQFVDFLQRIVVQNSIRRSPEVFRDASPIERIHPQAPPLLAVHGSRDTVIPVEQARAFVDRLRRVSSAEVGYLELPGAGHGFDMTDGARTGTAVTAIGLFLNQIHRSSAKVGVKAAM